MSSIQFQANASGTGVFSFISPNSDTNRSLSIPDATTTLVGTDTTQTLTNKTLTSPTLTTPNINSAQVATVSGTAPLYMARAWVAFDGTTAPPTILGSGNVTSVTKSAAGTYTVNFTTAMPDANYSAVASVDGAGVGNPAEAMSSVSRGNLTTSAKVTTIATSGSATDYIQINAAFFR
jgi:hypothetical protein